MATCNRCGGEIEFFHNGFNAIPIHLSGSCTPSGRSPNYGGGWGWIERESASGERFIFRWSEYPSYVNPNAHCPVCGAPVYFYQSPYGGRVFFDELGPPWPKHPCTSSDNPAVQRSIRDFKLEEISPSLETVNANAQNKTQETRTAFPDNKTKAHREIPEWKKLGWSPLLLSQAIPSVNGILINCTELLDESKGTELKLRQINTQDTFEEARGGLLFSYSMTMNSNRLISVLSENVVFIRQISGSIFELSTISITTKSELIYFTFRMKSA